VEDLLMMATTQPGRTKRAHGRSIYNLELVNLEINSLIRKLNTR